MKTILRKNKKINEDVTIPASLSNQYLSVKKQIADKQTKKDQILKVANQIDNEINVLTRNLIAIESKAASMQGETTKQKAKPTETKPTAEVTTESLDAMWTKYMNEDIIPELSNYPGLDFFVKSKPKKEVKTDYFSYIDYDQDSDLLKDYDDDYGDLENEEYDEKEFGNIEDGDALEGDYVFVLQIEEDGEDELIIAKIYKDSDEENWKVRVVQGSEEPLEDMQFDTELTKEEVIEKINEIPGFLEIEEVDIDEYEDLLDDKKDVDDEYYNDEDEDEDDEDLSDIIS